MKENVTLTDGYLTDYVISPVSPLWENKETNTKWVLLQKATSLWSLPRLFLFGYETKGENSIICFFYHFFQSIMKKVTDLNEKEVIHCPTEAKAIAICKLMHEAWLKRCSWFSYLAKNNRNEYKKNTCYYTRSGEYSTIDFYKKEWYTVYPASDFLTDKKAKSRPTYLRKALRDDGVVFERDAIGGRSLKEITDSISERKESIKRDEALLRSHRNLFHKKW